MPSGSGLVIRLEPRTLAKASRSASGVAPWRRSSWATGPPASASPTSRCSVETYSSPISVASCWAALTAASASRESCGALTVEPDAEGSRFDSCVSSPRTAEASAPTAASSGAAMPSPWASSAPSRWVGPTSGLPASAAAWTAAEIACCALVVGLKESIPHVLLLKVLVCHQTQRQKS